MSDDRLSRDAQLAADLEATVGVQRIGEVYAEAFLGAAGSMGPVGAGGRVGKEALEKQREQLEEFDSFVRDVLDRFPRLEAVLSSGLLSYEEKGGILDRVLGGRASPLLVNFLKVLARHGRMDLLRAVHLATHRRYDDLRGRLPVRISTAWPIPDALAAAVAQRLRLLVEGEPIIERHVDPSLIGGLVVRVGDTIFDGSVANQLERMREKMIDRSAHEIQSRRNRFRDPAGN